MSDLCIICGHDLRPEETQVCTKCVGRVRRDLYRIEMLYALLPAVIHAGYPSNTALGQPHGNDDTPLLGGTALVLSGAGTVDAVQPARPVGNHPPDRSHFSDQWESDPTPVLAVLESWVRDWAELKDEPLPSPSATITSEVGFLIRLCGWAGASHPAFDEFAAEVTAIRSRIEHVTAHDPATVYGASCIQVMPDGQTCGGQLVREYDPPCGRATDDRALCARRGCSDDEHVQGLSDWWTCRRCKRRTDHRRHNLAVHEQLLRVSAAS